MLPILAEQDATGHKPERVDGNQAVAELGLNRVEPAKAAIDRALRADPMNPAFLMTAGFVADRAKKFSTAVHYNTATLVSDPGAFPAANDLGVQLARMGRYGEAADALRRAVGARPDYALGWFNLGVIYAEMGPLHLPASQGALARAFLLDPTLRDRKRELTIDAHTYRTGLDLSKPLPPQWSFMQVERRAPVAVAGLLAALLVGLGLARTTSQAGRDFAETWLEPTAARLARVPLINRLRSPMWALGVTVAILVLPALRQPGGGATSVVAVAIGVSVTAGVAIRARSVIARRVCVPARQESWGPGMVFGVVTGAAGAPWAPLPVVRGADEAPRVHTAAPVVLATIAVALFVESALLEVPLTRSLAIASLIMAASTLLPIAPLDGAKIGKESLLVSAGVIGAAILVALGIA